MSERFLEADDLTVKFGGLTAVDHVSMAVDVGEIVGLIGPNGAGKTTFFNAVAGVQPITSGSVHLAGRDRSRSSASARARAGIARTFQQVQLFGSMTVAENLLYATEAAALGERPLRLLTRSRHRDPDLVDEVMELVGITDIRHTLAGDLPVGRARLAEFARALCNRPRLLMLDEPSSGLDAVETAHFGDLLVSTVASAGVGILLIEHDMSLVMRVCERLSVLADGRMIASGVTAEVAEDPVVHRAYLGVEAGAAAG